MPAFCHIQHINKKNQQIIEKRIKDLLNEQIIINDEQLNLIKYYIEFYEIEIHIQLGHYLFA